LLIVYFAFTFCGNESVGRQKQIVGADIVEVRPIPPNHITEFTAARLAYKIITYA